LGVGECLEPTPAHPKPRARQGPDLRAKAVAVLADHPDIGRNQLAKELGVTPHKARTLLDDLRPVNGTKVSM
jgi:predicted ArsR family transcriptional regulator